MEGKVMSECPSCGLDVSVCECDAVTLRTKLIAAEARIREFPAEPKTDELPREEVQLAPGVTIALKRNDATGNVYAVVGRDEESFVWCNVTPSYKVVRQKDYLVVQLREVVFRFRDLHFKCSACARVYRESDAGVSCCAQKFMLKELLDQFDDVPKGV